MNVTACRKGNFGLPMQNRSVKCYDLSPNWTSKYLLDFEGLPNMISILKVITKLNFCNDQDHWRHKPIPWITLLKTRSDIFEGSKQKQKAHLSWFMDIKHRDAEIVKWNDTFIVVTTISKALSASRKNVWIKGALIKERDVTKQLQV